MPSVIKPKPPAGIARPGISPLKIHGTTRDRDVTGIQWQPAPATSHLEAFRFYDHRAYKLLKQSEIHIRFRDGSEYAYYSPDADAFAEIYEFLRTAPHPGEVVWALLRSLFPYKELVGPRKGYKAPKRAKGANKSWRSSL